jgi:hypothetical protein
VRTSNIAKSQYTQGNLVTVLASSGKASKVLAYALRLLSKHHNLGLKILLPSENEDITGKPLLHIALFQQLH